MSSLQSQSFYLLLKYLLSNVLRKKSLAEQRRSFDKFGESDRLPSGIHVEKLVLRGMPTEWLTPEDVGGDEVVLYFHGGAYRMGSCNAYRAMASRIALATRRRVLIFEYRLAPEHPFPAAFEDATWMFHWLQENGSIPSKIIFAGDSSGGGLALAVALHLRDQGAPLPRALVCICPWVDLSLSEESIHSKRWHEAYLDAETLREAAQQYAGSNRFQEPLISPLYADLSGLPPLLIHVGEHEILHDEGVRLAAKAREAGVSVTLEVYQGMWHVWHYFAKYIPEGRQALSDIGLFLGKIFGDNAGVP